MSTYGHGPTRREQQILDLREAHLSVEEICARTELSESYVQQVISNLYSPRFVDWETGARAASSQLLIALRRHFPSRCGGAS